MLVLASRPSDSLRFSADLLGPTRAGPSLDGRLRRPAALSPFCATASPLAGRLLVWSGPAERDQPLSTGLLVICTIRNGFRGPLMVFGKTLSFVFLEISYCLKLKSTQFFVINENNFKCFQFGQILRCYCLIRGVCITLRRTIFMSGPAHF
jgi:hypothetical protein